MIVWYNANEVKDLLIRSVIQNEALRNERMIREYEALLAQLPKGSLVCRRKEYYYLKYRENGKLHDKYIGKDAGTVAAVRDKLALRKHYAEMLSALKQEQKTIHKMLEGLA